MFKSLIRTFAIVAAFIAGYMMPGLHVYSWMFKWMLIVMLFVTFLGIRFKRMKPERAHWLLTGANLMVALAAWGVCRLVFGGWVSGTGRFFRRHHAYSHGGSRGDGAAGRQRGVYADRPFAN